MITKLRYRLKKYNLIIFILTFILNYLIHLYALINHNSLISIIVAFNTIYLFPGLILLLIISPNYISYNLREFVVISFLISTILASISMLSRLIILKVININILPTLYVAFYLLLVIPLLLIKLVKNPTLKIRASPYDILLVLLCFISYSLITLYICTFSRQLTPDETSYIAWARYVLLRGDLYLVRSLIQGGRVFWTLLLASFLYFSNIPPHKLYLTNIMFSPMLALATTLLVPKEQYSNKLLIMLIFIITLTNPLLFFLSGLALNDLTLAFYMVTGIAFFVRAITDETLKGIFTSFVCFFLVFLIKMNLTPLLIIWIILVLNVFKYNKWYKLETWKSRVLTFLLIMPVCYLAVDIFNVANRFIIKSPITIPLPYSITTLFLYMLSPSQLTPYIRSLPSISIYGYLYYLCRILSPTMIGLPIAGMGLSLMLISLLILFNTGIIKLPKELKIMIYITLPCIWLNYVILIATAYLSDVLRYTAYHIPLLTVIFITITDHFLTNKKVSSVGIIMLLSSLILLILQIKLGTNLWLWREIPYVRKIMTEYILLMVIVLTKYFLLKKRIIDIRLCYLLSIHNKNKKIKLRISDILLILLITCIFINNVHGIMHINRSGLYNFNFEPLPNMVFSPQYPRKITFILCNYYYYLRPYLPDELMKNDFVFPLPANEKEFLNMLKLLPHGSLILISNKPQITWYDYSNSYIKKYFYMPINNKHISLLSKTPCMVVYLINSSLHLNDNCVSYAKISNVSIYRITRLNENLVHLNMSIYLDSKVTKKVFICIGTIRFLKFFSVILNPGLNKLAWSFPLRPYGGYIYAWSKIIIYDNNGAVLHQGIYGASTELSIFHAMLLLGVLICAILVIVRFL